jgi:hypothetical protein
LFILPLLSALGPEPVIRLTGVWEKTGLFVALSDAEQMSGQPHGVGGRLSKIGMTIVGLFAVVAGSVGLDMFSDGRSGAWRPLILATGVIIVLSSLWLQRDKPSEFSIPALLASPQPTVLVASRSRNFALGLASLCLFAAFADVTRLGNSETGYVTFFILILGLFGLSGSLLIATSLKPNRLFLGRHSLVSRSLFGSKEWRWEDVADFKATTAILRGKRRIQVKGYIQFEDRSSDGTRKGIKLSRLTGSNASLNNRFPLSDEELASLLNQWQARAIAQGGQKDVR